MAARPQTPFGDLLDALLKRRGLTVRSFARLVGVTPGMVSHAKRKTLSASAIARWADALGLGGPERDRFVQMAWLTHAPPYVRDLVERQAQEIQRLRGKLRRSE